MVGPVARLFRPIRDECTKYERSIMAIQLTELRIKMQCLQKQFLGQSSGNNATDGKGGENQ